MGFDLFGFSINKIKNAEEDKKSMVQVVVPENNDGSRDVIHSGALGGHFIELYDSGVVNSDEFNLIKKYRSMAESTEVDKAISEIVNDAITYEDNLPFPVKLNLDTIEDLTETTKKKIVDEFDAILHMLKFNDNGYELFRNWYIDGRIYFNNIIDGQNIKNGITKIVYVDPLYIKKIRNILRDQKGVITSIEKFFVYKPPVLSATGNTGSYTGAQFENAIKFTEESITYATSGLLDLERKNVISHLHKAIKPSNQLGMLEDAVVVYRVARAPERRIFYIDVGNLPKTKAEEYLNSVMNRYRNKIAYNTATGEIEEGKRHMSMLEDFWLPRREGGKGTEIDTLAGGTTLGEMDDVSYFRTKLYESLNVPIGRLDAGNSIFNMGNGGEITREEIKFSKFVQRLRTKFARGVFSDILYKQLIMKNIITVDDWSNIESQLIYQWSEDSHFSEIKKLAMLKSRVELVQTMDLMIERYYSLEYIRSNILLQTEEEAKELADQRKKEKDERDTTKAFDNMGQDLMAQQGGYGQYADVPQEGDTAAPAESKPEPKETKKESKK